MDGLRVKVEIEPKSVINKYNMLSIFPGILPVIMFLMKLGLYLWLICNIPWRIILWKIIWLFDLQPLCSTRLPIIACDFVLQITIVLLCTNYDCEHLGVAIETLTQIYIRVLVCKINAHRCHLNLVYSRWYLFEIPL